MTDARGATRIVDEASGLGAGAGRFASAAVRGVEARGVSVSVARLEPHLGGFFDPSSRRIVISDALRGSQLLEVFVHEFAHFLQWANRSVTWARDQAWGRRRLGRDVSGTAIMNGWIRGRSADNGRRATARVVSAAAHAVAVEAEAEALAIAIIGREALPLDRDAYGRRANAYLSFYVSLLRGASEADFPAFCAAFEAGMPKAVREVDLRAFARAVNGAGPATAGFFF